MSRQSKNAKNLLRAKQFSATRKNGGHGPATTTPKHGKKNVRWKTDATKAARAAVLQKSSKDKAQKSVLEQIIEKREQDNA
jgi:hypothetical protein